jgi:uncharacterized protein YndB with AHSA1/START domain
MVGPTGEVGTVGGDVREVDPPRTVEFNFSFAMPDGRHGPESVIHFTLAP